ncbi:MAG: MFS transporter [Pseudomonadota bacterium]
MNPISNNSASDGILDKRPMTRRQILAILLTICIAVLDGYDLSSMSFVAPVLSAAWGIDKAALGVLLASGLVGMAIGSLGLSPFADRFGRKPIILCALVLVTLGSLGCGLSESQIPLIVCRAVTGLGMGALVSVMATINGEFANTRNRSLTVACTVVGLPLGGAIGGVVSAAVLRGHDWHWVFLIGAFAGALMIVLVLALLPESPAFLVAKRPPHALERLNAALRRLGHAPVYALPPSPKVDGVSYRVLFSASMAPVTVRFIVVNVLMVMGGYYIMNWLPQIITSLGFAASTAILVTSTTSLLGVASPLVFGALTRRFSTLKMAAFVMCGFGAALVLLGFVLPVLWMFIAAACAASFFLSGSAAMFQASLVETFPPNTRASAVGFILGVGRIASGLGPYLAGLMFAAGMTRETVSLSFAVLAVIAGLLVNARRAKPMRLTSARLHSDAN